MKTEKEIKDEIEALVGEAYEIGHAHGSNAFRVYLGEKPRLVNTGWIKPLKKIFKLLFKEKKKKSGKRLSK